MKQPFDDVCPDQRQAFARFAETGDPADAAKVHFESCPDCAAAIERVFQRRAAGAEAVADAGVTKAGKAPSFFDRHPLCHSANVLAIAGMIFVVGLLALIGVHEWATKSQREVMADVVDNYAYFNDPRTGLCFSHTADAGDVSLVDCATAADRLNPKLAWLGKKTWYFQDIEMSVCYAQVIHHGHRSSFAVPCQNVERLFDASDGRFRYQTWK